MQSRSPAWVGAGLLVILALVVGNLLVWQRVKRPDTALQPGAMQVVSLAGTQVAPAAAGLLVVSSDGEYGSLTVENLPPLAPKQRYQLWLIGGGKRDSGAIFSVDHHGYYATEVFAPEPLAIYSTFCITIEPAGGSPQPTGDEVLTSVELPLNCSS